MRIAVFGDIHGHWIDFRDAVQDLQQRGANLDLVLQCGDAQPFRDEADVEYMNCPTKYRELGDYWMFHHGEETWPLPLLLFIPGNHEPYNLFDQNPNGCELAPNIEYMGRVAARTVGDVKIVGLGGVHSDRFFGEPHLRWPYLPNKKKQATYYNNTDINKALGFGNPDILLTHEWPQFMVEAHSEKLRSQRVAQVSDELAILVECLSPRWYFCAHMHSHAECQHGRTQIIGLSDFHRDPDNACVVLDTDRQSYEWVKTGDHRENGS